MLNKYTHNNDNIYTDNNLQGQTLIWRIRHIVRTHGHTQQNTDQMGAPLSEPPLPAFGGGAKRRNNHILNDYDS